MELLRNPDFWLGVIFILLTGCAVYAVTYWSARHAYRDEILNERNRDR